MTGIPDPLETPLAAHTHTRTHTHIHTHTHTHDAPLDREPRAPVVIDAADVVAAAVVVLRVEHPEMKTDVNVRGRIQTPLCCPVHKNLFSRSWFCVARRTTRFPVSRSSVSKLCGARDSFDCKAFLQRHENGLQPICRLRHFLDICNNAISVLWKKLARRFVTRHTSTRHGSLVWDWHDTRIQCKFGSRPLEFPARCTTS